MSLTFSKLYALGHNIINDLALKVPDDGTYMLTG
jgi:hypothetical protein